MGWFMIGFCGTVILGAILSKVLKRTGEKY
jgi:hypothetical protein